LPSLPARVHIQVRLSLFINQQQQHPKTPFFIHTSLVQPPLVERTPFFLFVCSTHSLTRPPSIQPVVFFSGDYITTSTYPPVPNTVYCLVFTFSSLFTYTSDCRCCNHLLLSPPSSSHLLLLYLTLVIYTVLHALPPPSLVCIYIRCYRLNIPALYIALLVLRSLIYPRYYSLSLSCLLAKLLSSTSAIETHRNIAWHLLISASPTFLCSAPCHSQSEYL
jgi:hypothetical protein